MVRERPQGRSCGALHRCLLGAALLLGLRLCVELRRAGSGPPVRSASRGPIPRPPGPHLPLAPVPPRGASKRQVTYVRSGRRAPPGGGGSRTPEPSCCSPRGRLRRKVSCKPGSLGPWIRIPHPDPAKEPSAPGMAAGLTWDLQSLPFFPVLTQATSLVASFSAPME
ncbi:Methyltransferase-like protein 24 [Sciurus carolinensis]|uniref:Methyltransferase-like protein 24 n=1 Tax=Sciurus carolinensis TaxID=30640 RepID=A0AA41MWG1_SCICA|nr:Methyltransferase-like protein 24 [Sciurus carolinensis]